MTHLDIMDKLSMTRDKLDFVIVAIGAGNDLSSIGNDKNASNGLYSILSDISDQITECVGHIEGQTQA